MTAPVDALVTQEDEVCPFCGSTDTFVERADYSSCYVMCNQCGAKGPTCCNETEADVEAEDAGAEPGEAAARRAWRRRAPDTTAERRGYQAATERAAGIIKSAAALARAHGFPDNAEALEMILPSIGGTDHVE